MKVDAGIGHHLSEIPATVKKLEAAGYDGVRTAEMNHDPFFPLLLAAEHSEKLEFGEYRSRPERILERPIHYGVGVAN